MNHMARSFYQNHDGSTRIAFIYDTITESGAFRFMFSDGTRYYGRTISPMNAHRVRNQMETFKALRTIRSRYIEV